MLAVRSLQLGYGAIVAVRGIDLDVGTGELVAVIGANGAGKTTSLKGIAGVLPALAGSILFDGDDITRMPVHERVRRGMHLVPEGRGIFARLTVAENLDMGAYLRRDAAGVRADLARGYALFPRLAERRRQLAGTLSGGEQQMLAIARALMGRPRLLLLDEPSMGLAPLVTRLIFDTIRLISAERVSILLIEQNARAALELAARAYVLEGGTVTLAGPSATLLSSDAVRRAYLGE
ncbi:MAG: ABC transporter ATP-binding protein [Rhodocyclaceae bacterium]|jgi:branched-chain amino acid transport system ATP-binding protein|nr:ABC transporter ATP-binding protein [Rhodocyclaceae bacterium]MCE2979783.1 ABC transporter ATP-binding protein [Betaproteobacteria bacterium]MCA3074472.1 ABC transporter ATP-binding protein [Rhodocyclaceae bacterium]MCA3089808.1 ABC transporter ATP-binding protein [Rhodocyclaceae bacterium]MCA3093456.1 ABC transporter ATP-binding protein [Rhodocyclaceae bacterium]